MPTAARRKPATKRRPSAPVIPSGPEASVLQENPAIEPDFVTEQQAETMIKEAASKRAPKARAGSLESRLAQTLAQVAIVPTFAGDQYSSFIIASRSAAFAHDLAELARVNKNVDKILRGMMDGGAYGGVIVTGMAMLLPILWGYGVLPAPPIDPFAPFYPTVPAGVLPRSALRQNVPSSATTPVGQPGGTGGAERVPPVQRSAQMRPEHPEGVVTVRPGAHPPSNSAAAIQ